MKPQQLTGQLAWRHSRITETPSLVRWKVKSYKHSRLSQTAICALWHTNAHMHTHESTEEGGRRTEGEGGRVGEGEGGREREAELILISSLP